MKVRLVFTPCRMESSESKWLKSVFCRTDDANSPSPKRIKFSDMSSGLQLQFPDKKFTSYDISQYIHEAFPNTPSRACGKSRQKHLLGLQRKSESTSSELVSSHSETDLLRQIQRLQHEVRELRKTSERVLCCQADAIIQHKSAVTQGPSSLEGFNQLDLQSVISELAVQAPDLYALFMNLGDVKRNSEIDDVTTEQTKAISSMCSLLNARLKLTEDAQYTERVQDGHWIWVYDNLNLHQVVRHEREGTPDWTVDWNDSTPQCSRRSLDCNHFLPSTEDAEALSTAAVQYTMKFLVEEFASLKDLKSFVPPMQSPHAVTKPTVAPMAILQKYKGSEGMDVV